MYEREYEERLEALEKKVEDLSVEVKANKPKDPDDVGLIPGAEYDVVPSVEDEVIFRFTARFGGIVEADSLLGLTDEEWKQFSAEDDA